MCSVHQLFCFCAVWFLNFPFFSQMLAASVYDKILPISQSTLRETTWQSGPTASSWGRVVPTEVGRQPRGFPTSYDGQVHGDGAEPVHKGSALPALAQALFTPLPSSLRLLLPLLPTNTHWHRLQSGRQLTLDLLGHLEPPVFCGRWQKTTLCFHPSQHHSQPETYYTQRQLSRTPGRRLAQGSHLQT